MDKMMVVGEVRVAEDKDFDLLRTYLTAESGWSLEYEKKGRISVWTKLKVLSFGTFISFPGPYNNLHLRGARFYKQPLLTKYYTSSLALTAL